MKKFVTLLAVALSASALTSVAAANSIEQKLPTSTYVCEDGSGIRIFAGKMSQYDLYDMEYWADINENKNRTSGRIQMFHASNEGAVIDTEQKQVIGSVQTNMQMGQISIQAGLIKSECKRVE